MARTVIRRPGSQRIRRSSLPRFAPRLVSSLGGDAPLSLGSVALTWRSRPATLVTRFEIRKTDEFHSWLQGLRDARARVAVRVERLARGNPGDVKPVGDGLSELRISYGPGYRVYYTRRGTAVIILLAGGDKTTQVADIELAKRLARNLPREA